MKERPIRLAVLLTHPVQYMAPWFRYIRQHCPELDLTVVYATAPTPEQQGTGFGRAFRWDVSLTEGYEYQIVRPPRAEDEIGSGSYRGLNVPEAADALLDAKPDVALIPGWHSMTYVQAIRACQRAEIPVLYRGDSTVLSGPSGWKRVPWAIHTRRRLAAYSAYLAVGRRAEAYLQHFGVPRGKIFHSPHAVDNLAFATAVAPYRSPEGRRAARAAFGLDEGSFVPLFVGKLDEIKRPIDLIEATARLGFPAQLLVVGGGALEGACRRRAEELGVSAVWAGFLNQSEIPLAYGAADCLVLPSASETWGLVVNEALASGLPAVVSAGVGCAPDLIRPGSTGEVFATGEPDQLARGMSKLQRALRERETIAAACQKKVQEFSFEHATAGLVTACRALEPPAPLSLSSATPHSRLALSSPPAPRVLAACGNMVIVSGLERMTFEVLGSLHRRGAAIHCVVNDWENHRIVQLADRLPASWTTAPHRIALRRQGYDWKRFAIMAWAMVRTSLDLLRDAATFRPTHILIPDHVTAVRNAPALALLRLWGIPVILRLPNRPDSTPFYRWLWGRLLPRLVDWFVVNSRFTEARLRKVVGREEKIRRIENAVAKRPAGKDSALLAWLRARPTLLTVGQIAPFKGTHLAVDAALALIAEGRDVQAAIVGREPAWPPELQHYYRHLRRKVEAAGAEERILFLGQREDVPELMAASYLLVAPIPEEESFGNVALEAKREGLPVVAFPAGGMAELVEHGVTGHLCREEDLTGLLAGIRVFLDDPERRAAAALASRRALERPDSPYRREVFEERWWSLFQEVRR